MMNSASQEIAEYDREIEPALIYVVDDDLLLGQIVEAILLMEGFRVRLFDDPALALTHFQSEAEKPDLLVTDFVMRPYNGMELIQKCRALTPKLRSILYSGNAPAQITDLYAVKPNAFIAKPFLPRNLVRLVESVLLHPA
jgi:DNA-binding NtrC family response regulator